MSFFSGGWQSMFRRPPADPAVDHRTIWTATEPAINATKPIRLDSPLYRRYETEYRGEALVYYEMARVGGPAGSDIYDHHEIRKIDVVTVEQDRVIAHTTNKHDLTRASEIAAVHFGDRTVRLSGDAWAAQQSGYNGVRVTDVPADIREAYEYGVRIHDTSLAPIPYQDMAQEKEPARAAEPVPMSQLATERGYTGTRQDDGAVHYARNDAPNEPVIIDSGDKIAVRGQENYAAAVAMAKERFGDVVQTNSMKPEFLRATIEGGLRVEKFASPEQEALYRDVQAQYAREQGKATPEIGKAVQEREQGKERPIAPAPTVATKSQVPDHPQHAQHKVPSTQPDRDPNRDLAPTAATTGLKVAPKPKLDEPKSPTLDL